MDIFHLFNIKTKDTSEIYKAVTTIEGLSKWWITKTEGSCEKDGVIIFHFTPDYKKEMKVLYLEENRLVEWECISGDEQWLGTKIKFQIIPAKEGTDVKLRHSGWKKETDFYGVCNYHWGLYMKSLKTLIETGIGNPHSF